MTKLLVKVVFFLSICTISNAQVLKRIEIGDSDDYIVLFHYLGGGLGTNLISPNDQVLTIDSKENSIKGKPLFYSEYYVGYNFYILHPYEAEGYIKKLVLVICQHLSNLVFSILVLNQKIL